MSFEGEKRGKLSKSPKEKYDFSKKATMVTKLPILQGIERIAPFMRTGSRNTSLLQNLWDGTTDSESLLEIIARWIPHNQGHSGGLDYGEMVVFFALTPTMSPSSQHLKKKKNSSPLKGS
jgi:hypothetical protein